MEDSLAGQNPEAPTAIELAAETRDQFQGFPRVGWGTGFKQSAEGPPARPTVRERFDQLSQGIDARSRKSRELAPQKPKLR